MTDLVHVSQGTAIVDSREIAEKFGKTHRHVLEAIKAMKCSSEFRGSNFRLSSYTTVQNKVLPCYEITRDGFSFLGMGFKGEKASAWKERYISAFNYMERSILSSPKTMESLSSIVKKIEENKDLASLHGRELAKYRKVKLEQEEEFHNAVEQAQMTLGIAE